MNMLHLLRRRLFLSPYSNGSKIILIGCKDFLLLKPSATPAARARVFSHHSGSQTHLLYCKASVYSYTSSAADAIPESVTRVDPETLEKKLVDNKQLIKLRQKLQEIGIEGTFCLPGKYKGLICPRLLAYFADRKISEETLRRNSVMQKTEENQITIAFPYRRNDELVSCKYCDINKKRYWQVANTEKIFYGLDDIKKANDIIIVEGELDKLAMEEAGFKNCVSVPDGAPPKISKKDLKLKYRYLWNCKDYISEASRIILVTDGDPSGQILAEELAQCLGRERCWTVKWPKKNATQSFKDANEIFYGLDDIKEASDIIIVGGEMDKLAMEEAGFKNCVSVPFGALSKVLSKGVTPKEEDLMYRFVWNCKDDTAKASRIILATYSNPRGQALAEELARRLGRERCWIVKWPKKNDAECFKNAMETLMNLGAEALRDAIAKAELYQMGKLD